MPGSGRGLADASSPYQQHTGIRTQITLENAVHGSLDVIAHNDRRAWFGTETHTGFGDKTHIQFGVETHIQFTPETHSGPIGVPVRS